MEDLHYFRGVLGGADCVLFLPQDRRIEPEDIDHLFDRGGITSGVWSTWGRTVERRKIGELTRRVVCMWDKYWILLGIITMGGMENGFGWALGVSF